jgi:hypothetical protein
MWFSGNTGDQFCDECKTRPLAVGSKVVLLEEVDKVRTIIDYQEDLCGEGCCSGYALDGDEFTFYWRDELRPLD